MRVWPGTAYPLGASWDGSGTNFALFSEVATAVELCLFGPGAVVFDPEVSRASSSNLGIFSFAVRP